MKYVSLVILSLFLYTTEIKQTERWLVDRETITFFVLAFLKFEFLYPLALTFFLSFAIYFHFKIRKYSADLLKKKRRGKKSRKIKCFENQWKLFYLSKLYRRGSHKINRIFSKVDFFHINISIHSDAHHFAFFGKAYADTRPSETANTAAAVQI